MTISDETLMAYVDGELDASAQASVEAAIQQDPSIGKRIAEHRALREKMQSAFSAVLEEPVPERLIQAARGGAPPAHEIDARRGTLVELSTAGAAAQRKNPAAQRTWQPAALAASLLLGLGLGFLAWHGSAGLIRPGAGGGLVAGAALADSLSTQLSDERSANKIAITGLSFRDKSGDYCRTFSLTGGAASSGLACREGANWRIKALAQSTPAAPNAGNYRRAGTEDSPAIRAAIESSIDGEPLDRAGEIAARQAGWAAPPKP
jgi:anti-sigma factor RsiW